MSRSVSATSVRVPLEAREIAGNPAAAAITAWYLLQHPGDEISFVTDTDGDWPFRGGSRTELHSYAEVTDPVVDQLIRASVLSDHGKSFVDPDEPDAVYLRDLRNVWWSDERSCLACHEPRTWKESVMEVRRPTWCLRRRCPVCDQGSSLVLMSCPGCGALAVHCAEEGSDFLDPRLLVPATSSSRCPQCGEFPLASFQLATGEQILAWGLAPGDYE